MEQEGRMSAVITFIIGVLIGALGAFIAIAASYGTDADDYYKSE